MFDSVTVAAAARLHLGFLDMNGGLGRRFGGLGLAIDRPATRLTIRRAAGAGGRRIGSGARGAPSRSSRAPLRPDPGL